MIINLCDANVKKDVAPKIVLWFYHQGPYKTTC